MARRTKKTKQKPAERPRPELRETPAAAPAPAYGRLLAGALAIIAAGTWIYWPALGGGWVWDDNIYVTDNPLLHDLHGLWRIWFEPGAAREYYPLDATAWWIEWHLWGLATPGYHVINLLCHLAGSLLVWRLLARLGLRYAWLGGLLFAVHPVQVESVAWISELKNTLSLPFFLLALLAWIDFDERRRDRDYYLALALFTVAMLGKPTMAGFPLVILLYAWWKRGRVEGRDLKASVPFFVVSLALGVAAGWMAQRSQTPPSPAETAALGGLGVRLVGLGQVLTLALRQIFWPVGLIPDYPPPTIDFSLPQLLPWPVLAAILLYLWTQRRGWGRHVLLGLGFALLMLAPVLAFVVMNFATMAWSMDHLLYLPLIGLVGLAAAGLEQLADRAPVPLRAAGIAVVALAVAWLAWLSHGYARLYAGPETLLTYTLKHNPLAWRANVNLGVLMMKDGRTGPAIAEFEQALKIEPNRAETHYNYGKALAQDGHASDALEQYEQALAIDPTYAEAQYDTANLLAQSGRTDEALDHYRKAEQGRTDYTPAYYNMGNLLKQLDRLDEAAAQYQAALQIDPDQTDARYNLGNVLLREGQTDEAIAQFRAVLQTKPDYTGARLNLAETLLKTGHAPEAIEQFNEGLKDHPDDARLHYGLGNALFVSGQTEEAVAELEQAVRLDPSQAGAHYNLGYALMQAGRPAEAMTQFEETLKLNPDDAGARQNLERLQALVPAAPAK
ncbi:MAG TPA: tetratricopeptide repeat protein [Candidatus Methylacidiphilales bacterium]|nr:tetratricopeptide repeat protein [Candidatus Methylacidiphilales bacterium]